MIYLLFFAQCVLAPIFLASELFYLFSFFFFFLFSVVDLSPVRKRSPFQQGK